MSIGAFELESLRAVFRHIETEVVPRVREKQKWRLYGYWQLAERWGSEDDWRHDGKVRLAIMGGEGRAWLRSRFRLWWKADDEHHVGLVFTADCRTGLEWDRQRIADRTMRDAEYLADAARAAAHMQASFKGHFRDVEAAAERLVSGSRRLHDLSARKTALGVTR